MSKENIIEISKVSMDISSFAIQAMLYEASCYPSPGLVSPVSSGAHSDMDFFTFLDSTSVLGKYMPLFVQQGYCRLKPKDIFINIRNTGIEAEKEMLVKTKSINTHKGMLFLLGVCCAAVGKVIYEKKSFKEIREIIIEMTEGIVQKELSCLVDNNNLSHGEILYLKYKNQGIRGEVEKGIPTVFINSLEFYRQSSDMSMNDRLVHTLIGIMRFCDDSTILYRHNLTVLEEVKEKADDIIKTGGMRTSCGRKKINALCEEFVERRISPGGSADLLGVTIFLSLVEEYMEDLKA